MKPFVSVIIPIFRDWFALKDCLSSLSKQTYEVNDFEIIIVNNDPTQDVPDSMTFTSNTVVVLEEKPGSYAARNKGLTIAKGEIIGFTDADCIPDKNWIKNAVEFLEENNRFSRVAGSINIIKKTEKPTIIGKYNQLYAFPQIWLINNGGGSVTANLFVYKSVFNEVGGFDESLMSMGDKYWGMKAEAAGFKIAYAENVSVLHPPRTLSELIKKEKRHGGAVKISKQSNFKMLKPFFWELLPKPSIYRFIFSKRKDLRIIDRFAIPILRHFLMVVRAYEALKVQRGKKPSRT
jgi:glycosyltransferase involved in cell wall biosynthesis